MKSFKSLLAGAAAMFFPVAAVTGLFAGCGNDSQNKFDLYAPTVIVIDSSSAAAEMVVDPSITPAEVVVDTSSTPTEVVVDSSSH
jgi:hypothetical protein